MAATAFEIELPELPPLADDGSVGTDDQGVPLVESVGEGGLDDRPFEDAGDGFDTPLDDDEASWISPDADDLDVGGDDLSPDAEDGWLDDRTMNLDMDLGLGSEGDVTAIDEGLEGLDDVAPRSKPDDDSTDLPALPRGGSEDEGVVDDRIEIDMAG